MKSSKLISSAIAMLICFLTFGQEKNITGTVTDKNGPLPGASIVIKGTTNGVASDTYGKYAIKAKSGDVLVFSYIGYQTKGVTVGTSNTINVVLNEQSNQLEDVVVVGSGRNVIYSEDNNIKSKPINSEISEVMYDKNEKSTVLQEVVIGALGIKKTKDATVSAQKTINAREINQASSPSVLQSLNGKVSGLQVNATSNGVNGETRVVLRGNRSITGNSQALIVIDNVISSTETLNQLPPNIVDNVNVIKGAQGAALYGEQGVNGVIVVTTKKGYNNKTTIEYDETEEEEKTPVKPKSTKIEVDQEEYENFIENQFESPKSAPLSTFSIDVDNASYTNVRRFINNGQTVPKDAVRVEEMVNFFKYNYPQPQSEHPFSINTDYNDCPWNSNNKIVRIGLQGKDIQTKDLPNSNLVFLIDVSGSMSDTNKLPLLKQSLKILVNQLRKEDRISIVVYAGAAGLVLPSTSGSEKETIINSLDKLNAGGSTAGGAGIELAYKVAQENFIKNGNNRVILATDGDFNVGASSNTDMQTLIEEKRKSKIKKPRNNRFHLSNAHAKQNYFGSPLRLTCDLKGRARPTHRTTPT